MLHIGLDVGSTTVKIAVLDDENNFIYKKYQRHYSDIKKTLAEVLEGGLDEIKADEITIAVTGSGGISAAKWLEIPFIQEVSAGTTAIETLIPETDVAIELGGEDAKIIYFTGGLEERMNGVCAGGTGSFIDQMAALLQTDAEGLNKAAESYKEIYPIAARCGVFAKTDIQPLINEGATTADLAASIFQAVVNQTISGLACGKPIRGCVAFLGGPLHFMPELKKAFIRTLKLTDETTVDPENSHLFAAMGAALEAEGECAIPASKLMERLSEGVKVTYEMPRLEPLFATNEEYDTFKTRHASAVLPKGNLSTYNGNAFLGIDAGSTTTKMVLIGGRGELLFSFYANNKGDPIKTAKEAIGNAKSVCPCEQEEKPVAPKKEPVSVRSLPVKKPTQREIALRIAEEPELTLIYNEAQSILGTFGYDTQALILMIYDYYGFPPEVILMLLQHQKCEGKVSSSAIKSRAEDWAKRGIDTLEEVEKELLSLEKINTTYEQIKGEAGLEGSSLSPRVSKYLREWAVNWNCSGELIAYALKESNKTFSDANKLLKKWANSGITTPEEAMEKAKKTLPKEVKKSYDTEKVGKSSVLDWARKFADGEENI